MRKKCLSTPPAWAFPDPEYADHSAANGWDVQGSAGPKTASTCARCGGSGWGTRQRGRFEQQG